MTSVSKFYSSVIHDVVESLKEDFADEGIEPQVLEDLKRNWENRLSETGAFEPEARPNTAAQYATMLAPQNRLVTTASPMPAGGTTNISLIRAAVNLKGAAVTMGGSAGPTTFVTTPQLIQTSAMAPRLIQPHPQLQHGAGNLSEPAQAAAMALPTALYPSQAMGKLMASGGMHSAAGTAAFALQPGGPIRRTLVTRMGTGTQVMPGASYQGYRPLLVTNSTPQRSGHIIVNGQPAFLLQSQPFVNLPQSHLQPQSHMVDLKTYVINENTVIKKSQLDGTYNSSDSDTDSDEDDDFIAASEADPASVRPARHQPSAASHQRFNAGSGSLHSNLMMSPPDSVPPPHSTLTSHSVVEDLDDLGDEDLGVQPGKQEAEEEEIDDDKPLNSEDDISDEEGERLFETDNVVVCQFDKITRARNKWKFHLKDGIMTIQGKDHVFQKANGDADW